MSKRKQRQTFPILILVAGGLLLIITAVIILAQNNARKNTVQPVTAASNQEEADAKIERVTLTDSKTALDSGSAVFVDVRGAEVYAGGHIPGALSIPLNEIETRLDELDPTQWIITYCTWPNEESSARAALILLDNGFTNVTPILGGFTAWQQAGYPIE